MFDEFLEKRARRNAEPFRPFDIDTDYKLHADGRPRYQGVRDFLKSRGIALPEGTAEDLSTDGTVCGLGNRKNELVNDHLASAGVEAYPGTVAFLKYLRRINIKTAVVTSILNCQEVLQEAKVEDLFDVSVDGECACRVRSPRQTGSRSLLKAIDAIEDAWTVPDFGSTSAVVSSAMGLNGLFDDPAVSK